jgi:hypothetical protein
MVIEDDEIAVLARVAMSLGDGCQKAVDDNIANALGTGEWDEVNKWHRVRARIVRMQLQMSREDAVELGNARPTPGTAGS